MAKFAPQYNLFKIIDSLKLASSISFWGIFVLSVLPQAINIHPFTHAVNVVNIILLVLFFVIETIIDYVITPQADSKRRDDFIDKSFGSKFSPTPSIGYFDTEEVKEGLYKAVCNLFENSYFTYSLVKAITIKKTILPLLVLIATALLAYKGIRNVPFGLTILQMLFSATLLGNLIKHFVLMARLSTIHEALINLFQHEDLKENTVRYQAYIYRYWLQYETLHSRINADIPSKFFYNLNPQLTDDWNELKIRYGIQ